MVLVPQGPYKDVVVGYSDLQILVPIAFYGTIAAGGIFSCASQSFTAAELARQIQQGVTNLVICSKGLKHVAVEAARMCGVGMDRVLMLDSNCQNWSRRSVDGNESLFGEKKLTWERITDPAVLETSIINLLYSSGTTEAPKGKLNSFPALRYSLTSSGVCLPHQMIVAQVYISSQVARE